MYWHGFVHLWFPHICLQCGTDQLDTSKVLCSKCIQELPYCDFYFNHHNPVEKIFWGRADIAHANALLFFTKNSIVQLLITELKYRHNKKAGWMLGILLGESILQNKNYQNIDLIIPIPISEKTRKARTYNQSEIICEGIVQIFRKPIITNCLFKKNTSNSQTKKDRQERMYQATPIFYIKNQYIIQSKNILIVDDVITTGATMEAASQCVTQAAAKNIFLMSTAYTI